MIDSHCHLQLCRDPVPDILQRAHELGVTSVIQVATDLATARWGMEVAQQTHPIGIYPSAGLYPSRAEGDWETQMPELKALLGTGQIVALGEVGIDLHHATHFLDRQEAMLRAQIELALEADLPIIFHIRQSYEQVRNICAEFRSDRRLRGVWHCFDGTLEQARQFVDWGWMISFSGMLTYKKNCGLREVAQALPLDSIMIETDSPYLSPEPLRSEKNEPSKVSYVLEALAKIKACDREELDHITTNNTLKLFGISPFATQSHQL